MISPLHWLKKEDTGHHSRSGWLEASTMSKVAVGWRGTRNQGWPSKAILFPFKACGEKIFHIRPLKHNFLLTSHFFHATILELSSSGLLIWFSSFFTLAQGPEKSSWYLILAFYKGFHPDYRGSGHCLRCEDSCRL